MTNSKLSPAIAIWDEKQSCWRGNQSDSHIHTH